ncbi:hypothetical protein GGR77_003872 [Xanthomonas translucens]
MPLHHHCNEPVRSIGRADVGYMAVTVAAPAIIGQ